MNKPFSGCDIRICNGFDQRQIDEIKMNNLSQTTRKKLKRKSVPGERAKLLNIPRNWLHQALFYMDRTEFWVRVFIEGGGVFCLLFPISMFLQFELSDWRVILVSFFLVHSLNWIFNGNWWALAMFTFPGIRNAGESATCDYLSKMATRLKAHNSIAALVVYGSPARGQWHDRSDLDLRILREKGFFNGLKASAITMSERLIAFLSGQPVDLFLADSSAFLKKMREDERPIVLLKRGVQADEAIPDEEVLTLDVWPTK